MKTSKDSVSSILLCKFRPRSFVSKSSGLKLLHRRLWQCTIMHFLSAFPVLVHFRVIFNCSEELLKFSYGRRTNSSLQLVIFSCFIIQPITAMLGAVHIHDLIFLVVVFVGVYRSLLLNWDSWILLFQWYRPSWKLEIRNSHWKVCYLPKISIFLKLYLRHPFCPGLNEDYHPWMESSTLLSPKVLTTWRFSADLWCL